MRATELARWCFANNSVIIVSATMKLEQNLVRLTPYNKKQNVCFRSDFFEISACSKDPQSAVLQKAVNKSTQNNQVSHYRQFDI